MCSNNWTFSAKCAAVYSILIWDKNIRVCCTFDKGLLRFRVSCIRVDGAYEVIQVACGIPVDEKFSFLPDTSDFIVDVNDNLRSASFGSVTASITSGFDGICAVEASTSSPSSSLLIPEISDICIYLSCPWLRACRGGPAELYCIFWFEREPSVRGRIFGA